MGRTRTDPVCHDRVGKLASRRKVIDRALVGKPRSRIDTSTHVERADQIATQGVSPVDCGKMHHAYAIRLDGAGEIA
jgi:hypothetical protein